MKKNVFKVLTVAVVLCWSFTSFGQGNTTSSMYGVVTDESGTPLQGAGVVAIHTPSGTKYGAITRQNGNFNLNGMRVGGPYEVTISSSGYSTEKNTSIFLQLGQAYGITIALNSTTTNLNEVIVGAAKSRSNTAQTGAESVVNREALALLPTVSRSLADFARTNPQVNVTGDNVISVAGSNNRYNSIFIDGAVNNDVFGLAASGTNGGQTGGSPISLDAIDQIQISVAPYDVTLGGFAGGGINAVTKSGTNQTSASAYSLFRNEQLAGRTPTNDENVTREKLAEFNSRIFGFTSGGALVKNKLFYFLSVEAQRDITPQPFVFSDYRGNSTEADLARLSDKFKNEYNYDAGGYIDNARELNSNKIFAKIDYNINEKHKLMVRHNYVYNEAVNANRSSSNTINFYNNGIFFPSITNSTSAELTSQLSSNVTNNLIIGYTDVRDDRNPLGENMPYVTIRDGSGSIRAGSEQFSTANQLNQKILTLTDNLKVYRGNHSLTFGMHHEFYDIYNLFIRQNFGSYTFSSLNSFLNNDTAIDYDRGYSLVDNKTGDGSAAAAQFQAMQLGFYAQDEYKVNNKLSLTAGLRLDVPLILTDPITNPEFNSTTTALLAAEGKDLQGAEAGKAPGAQILFSPRVGFNYAVKKDKSAVIRGGTGIFTSRVPFVWPGGMFTNNGYTVGGVFNQRIPYNPVWNNQPQATDLGRTDRKPSGQMDLFAQDFKYPQVWRTSLAFDKELPHNIRATVEGIFSKTLNNLLVENVNIKNSTETLDGGKDDRPLYDRRNPIDNTYSGIYLISNTNKGYNATVTGQLQRIVSNGLSTSIAYTFGRSMTINDGTSSQNSSNWRYVEQVNGRNNLGTSLSDFDLGHRISGYIGYSKEYAKNYKTSASLFFNGQSGRRFSYVIGDGRNMTNDDNSDNELIFVPARQSDINLIDIKDNDGNVTKTAAQQWSELQAYIESDKHLSDAKGGYSSRNGARLPFETVLDFRLAQDFYIRSNGKKHALQVTFDVFNVTNLINKNWGRRHFIGNDQFALYQFTGFESGTNKPTYQYKGDAEDQIWTIDDSGINSSRWQGQIGLRYSFN